ncbi:MAG: hypothetical protein HFH45_03580 [Bacilli bacterium]|nr:hypothetical protein [Bacilli bacterium]
MTSKITILEKTTGEILKLNNAFNNINECIEHLESIKQCKNIIIKKVEFKEA